MPLVDNPVVRKNYCHALVGEGAGFIPCIVIADPRPISESIPDARPSKFGLTSVLANDLTSPDFVKAARAFSELSPCAECAVALDLLASGMKKRAKKAREAARRPKSYTHMVEFISLNDDWDLQTVEELEASLMVCVVSETYGRPQKEVAEDVAAYRTRERLKKSAEEKNHA